MPRHPKIQYELDGELFQRPSGREVTRMLTDWGLRPLEHDGLRYADRVNGVKIRQFEEFVLVEATYDKPGEGETIAAIMEHAAAIRSLDFKRVNPTAIAIFGRPMKRRQIGADA